MTLLCAKVLTQINVLT